MEMRKQLKDSFLANAALAFVNRFVGPLVNNFATIFMLHRFSDPAKGVVGHDPAFVRACLEELRRQKYNLVSVDEIVSSSLEGRPLRRAVAFTLDDGYYDQAQIGGQLLAAYDCPATIYLITSFVDGGYWPLDAKIQHMVDTTRLRALNIKLDDFSCQMMLGTAVDKLALSHKLRWYVKSLTLQNAESFLLQLAVELGVELSRLPEQYDALTWDDARALEKQGIHFGPHTVRHPVLSNESDEYVDFEIGQSIEAIARKLDAPSKIFCYPTGRAGDFSVRDMSLVKAHGCIGALAAEPGYFKFGTDFTELYQIPRFSLPARMFDFKQCIFYVEQLKVHFRYRTSGSY